MSDYVQHEQGPEFKSKVSIVEIMGSYLISMREISLSKTQSWFIVKSVLNNVYEGLTKNRKRDQPGANIAHMMYRLSLKDMLLF